MSTHSVVGGRTRSHSTILTRGLDTLKTKQQTTGPQLVIFLSGSMSLFAVMCNTATVFTRHSFSVHKCSPTASVEYQPGDLAATWTNRGGSPSDPFSPAGAPPRRRGGGGAAGLIPEPAMAPPWAPTTSATSSVVRRGPSCSAASQASSMRRPIPGRFPSTTSSSVRRSGREGSRGRLRRRRPGRACRRLGRCRGRGC